MFIKSALPVLLAFALSVENVAATTLIPIRPDAGTHIKRQDQTALNLQNQETFLWGADDGSKVANLTVDCSGDNENILSMEKFDGMVTSVQCTNGSISMTFNDDENFQYAQRTWDWVNGADNHSFVMVAGPGNCGNNPTRIPFIISTMQFDQTARRAILAAQQSDWETVAHSYDLVVGSVNNPAASSTGVQTRDLSKTAHMNFNHNFPFSVSLSTGAVSASLSCANCSTAGQFNFQFKISTKFFIPKGASMTVTPQGVSAMGQVRLGGSGDLVSPLNKTIDIASIPLDALDIPGVLKFGPFLKIAVGASLSPMNLAGGITTGATAKLSDSAVMTLDLLHPSNNKFSGWTPDVEALPFNIDATLSTTLSVFLQPSLDLEATVLGKGFDVGLNMKIPSVNARISAVACKFSSSIHSQHTRD